MIDTQAIDVTDAAGYVGEAMRGRLDDLAALRQVIDGDADLIDQRELEALDVGAEFEDHELQSYGSDLTDRAEERLDQLPLCIDRTTVFEIVLGTGGPDDRLLVECDTAQDWTPEGSVSFEIRRVLYRYSWSGSAEVELSGEDRETAEAFARRVVPELVE